ncbi:hypothetical protein NPX13_g7209 [Xylaria arbuscula]|uniref:Protein NO VEIN C-terminal domain-containing protein n=1 Tax=Xylaria arbuscula TaxID=114810 RepID=A0A9W8NAF5_9PEZI|nr:hypothetical protein NPX13_g7209 [Xylaria arbuscula]
MTVPRSRASARELVRRITRDHGFVSPERLEQLETFDPELRRDIEEALLTKDRLIGSSVLTLATNLYTSKARFVFELLQNADDNTYNGAKASGDIPYVSFHVHPGRIIVECNEDGFTDKNLAAICTIGKSSKTGAQGYIGEKGIGFKSVFMAASRVHIQSGMLSFSFRHGSGDSGMGMISPLWEETGVNDEVPLPFTRFTLYLHEDGEPEQIAKTRQSIQAQFEDLQETLLLFMKNLRKIHVVFYNETSQQQSSVTYSIQRPKKYHAILKKTRAMNGVTKEDVKRFHITKHNSTDLAKNENRTYSALEETTRAYSKSQVILGFPLTESDVPIVEPQDLFVFLPVRPVGFNFLIQADFVTDANRQDVVQDSLRNLGLVQAVADAFIKAILQFCKHDSLRFQWMRYLPKKDQPNMKWRGLWLELVQEIESRLKKTALFYDRHNSRRRLLTNLCNPKGDIVDEKGDPLFEEDAPGKLISCRYINSDLSTLRDYGLRWCTTADVLEWVEQDLRRGVSSRMKSSTTPENWHSKVAQLFNSFFDKKQHVCADLKKLEMIPANNGAWVSSQQTSVYFHTINTLEIPSNIDLRLVMRDIVNPDRLTLFKNLGVKIASVDMVRKSILRFYIENREPDLVTSVKHLNFLFSTHKKPGRIREFAEYAELKLLDQNERLSSPSNNQIYISNADSYGAWELFRHKPDQNAPGFPTHFLHQEYFVNDLAKTEEEDWVHWLYDSVGVRRYVGFGPDKHGMEALSYILTYRPEKFLGAFHEFFLRDPTRARSTKVDPSTAILCRGGRKIPLIDTYFPTNDHMARTEKFLGQEVFFPWLQLEFQNDSHNVPPSWESLLNILKIPVDHTDIDFALVMLKYLVAAFNSDASAVDTTKLFELVFFSAGTYIYIPGPERIWTVPALCVWDAPQDLATKHVLKSLYRKCFCKHGRECPYFPRFFIETLGIRASCSWEDYVEELEEFKDNEYDNVDTITGIYEAIDALRTTDFDEAALRETFEEEALIYASVDDQTSWYKPSQCVWSKSARLRGRVSLDEEYERLEGLFTHVLGVKYVDLQMAIDELKHTASRPSSSVPEVKNSIWTVNSLLVSETSLPSPSGIIESSIFPVHYPSGGVKCQPIQTEFFVVDRELSRKSFMSKVKLLDFSLKEVKDLRPFLNWLGLQDRYLSCCTKEVTSFPGQGATLISTPSFQIRHKAYAFLQIACHFGSPRTSLKKEVHRLYKALQNAKIFATDDVSLNLQVSQDGNFHQVECTKTTLHLDEHDSALHAYIPRKSNDQQYVFTNKLARALFQWMMTDPTTQIQDGIEKDGVDATRNILLSPYSKISEALEDNARASFSSNPDGYLYRGIQNLGISDENDDTRDGTFTPTSGADNVRGTTASDDAGSYLSVRPLSSNRSSLARSPAPSFEPPTPARDGITHHPYVETLSRVIAAGRRASIPVHGGAHIRRPPGSINDAVDLGLRSASQVERDCKVGAAGELYVFELLSHLHEGQGLPLFSRANWQSTIRKYVTVHPEYADMETWRGRETSDITYLDVQGTLTDELINKGCLTRDLWEGKRPSYFIEVKTTTGSCDTPFYMSKAQYQLMQDNTSWPNNANGNIYVVFRVYYLGQDTMDLEIYVDPEALRRTDRLKFQSELWSIVPATD